MIFSCASESVRKPRRLAGTCRRYSNSAIPQLMIAATYQGRSARLRRCAYQATVMKTFEQISSRMVGSAVIVGFYWGDGCDGARGARSATVRPKVRMVRGAEPRF